MLDRKLEPHDSNQLELKLAYVINSGEKRQRYKVESFMFLPRTLGVTRLSYSSDRFYEDTAAFIRLKTPTVALAALGREGQATTWFEPLQRSLDRILANEESVHPRTIRRFKVLGCIYRSALRDEGNELTSRIEELPVVGSAEAEIREHDLVGPLRAFLGDLERARQRLHDLGSRCEHAAMPREFREIWWAVDEYISMVSEEVCTRLVTLLDQRLGEREDSPLFEVREQLASAAVEDYRYRRARGYPSYARPGSENEALPYRRRILKRIVSSGLYLDIRQEEAGQLVTDAIGMVSAALAMLFSTGVGLFALATWGQFSVAFVVAVVISYMLKDRIKEWGKRAWGKRFSRFMPDHAIEIQDPDGRDTIGKCKESFSVVQAGDVDDQIHRLRHVDHPTTTASAGRPESVVRYTKEITLSSEGLKRQMEGVEGLNDIIRFNLGRWRERMDQPEEDYRLVDPDTRQLVTVRCARVYHVNFVLRMTIGTGREERTHTERVRVVLDQRGIKRIEPIQPGPHLDAVDRVLGGTLMDQAEPA